MKQNRMYDDFAHLWTLISDPSEYVEEARYWREALRRELGPGRHEILELGVGGGNNLSHLVDEFQATAVDLSEKMLANSIKLNPSVDHHVGDMRTVRLGRTFKAVLIHDAIMYMLTEEDLRATFETARVHLEPGGVLIVAPDWFKETLPPIYTTQNTNNKDGIDLTFFEYSHIPDPSGTITETVFVYFIKEGGKLRVEQDLHITGLFPLDTWERLIKDAGFEFDKSPYDVHDDGHEAYLLIGRLK